jgi:hypothetical protein
LEKFLLLSPEHWGKGVALKHELDLSIGQRPSPGIAAKYLFKERF